MPPVCSALTLGPIIYLACTMYCTSLTNLAWLGARKGAPSFRTQGDARTESQQGATLDTPSLWNGRLKLALTA